MCQVYLKEFVNQIKRIDTKPLLFLVSPNYAVPEQTFHEVIKQTSISVRQLISQNQAILNICSHWYA